MSKPITIRKSGKGQIITIPAVMLRKLNWRQGDILLSSVRGDALLIQRMRPPEPLMSIPDEKSTGVGK
jgi:antitoxin component of MazEF toxin-antitoxin module